MFPKRVAIASQLGNTFSTWGDVSLQVCSVVEIFKKLLAYRLFLVTMWIHHSAEYSVVIFALLAYLSRISVYSSLIIVPYSTGLMGNQCSQKILHCYVLDLCLSTLIFYKAILLETQTTVQIEQLGIGHVGGSEKKYEIKQSEYRVE
uniref:Hemoglobin subunit alpha n=1 Tax=Anthurium amnicola TaxID=1678845 RepID=A0A1D1XGJ6_9ARAE